MNFSKILATAALALVSALVLVQAGHNNNNNNNYSGNNYSGNNYGAAARAQQGPYSAIASHYPNGGCHGYQCNKRTSPSPYGPYHSYAVRPAVYGGHGLYNYQGYARHHPAPPAPGARHARSHGAGPRRGARPSYAACRGPNCGRGPARSYAPARPTHYRQSHQGGGYGLRPVKAVALAPGNGYDNSNRHNGNNYNNNNNYHRGGNDNYQNQRAPSNYAGRNSNQYNEQRHQRGGGGGGY